MVLIALVATLSAAYEKQTGLPFAGLLATAFGALMLGLLAGVLVLLLTAPAVPIAVKAGLLVAGTVIWKIRESVKPPSHHEEPVTDAVGAPGAAAIPAADSRSQSSPPDAAMVAHPGSKRFLVPQRGSLLDRFIPILVLGVIAFFALGNAIGAVTK